MESDTFGGVNGRLGVEPCPSGLARLRTFAPIVTMAREGKRAPAAQTSMG
jgi:hypothetical protein